MLKPTGKVNSKGIDEAGIDIGFPSTEFKKYSINPEDKYYPVFICSEEEVELPRRIEGDITYWFKFSPEKPTKVPKFLAEGFLNTFPFMSVCEEEAEGKNDEIEETNIVEEDITPASESETVTPTVSEETSFDNLLDKADVDEEAPKKGKKSKSKG